LALAGHVHWNTLTTIDGTPHLTLQSLTEAFTTGQASACTAVLEIDRDVLRWTVSGQDPFAAQLPWRTSKARWFEPLDPFRGRAFEPSLSVATA
jgi:3',5'-cyclic-AMP phosphodiesterase